MSTLQETLGELLTPEIETALKGKHIIVSNKKDDYVPKARLDEVISQRDEFKSMSEELNTKIDGLSKSTKTVESLKEELTTLKEQHTASISEYDNKIAELQKGFAIDKAMTDAGVRNTKAVKALIDISKVTIDGENLIGLSSQLDALKKTDDYLFTPKEKAPGGDTGGKIKNFTGNNPFSRKTINISEQMRITRENPSLAAKLKKEAME